VQTALTPRCATFRITLNYESIRVVGREAVGGFDSQLAIRNSQFIRSDG
jgi:hypothetical protein